MQRNLAALADTEFDLLVIGGGITGAGIARDAALRGLQVALVDQGDFASGTSSQSSKLIHGGFRYLAQGAFGLVHEACRERRILQELAPHLVTPQAYLFVVYHGDARPLWQIRAGMTLYDLMALYRNPGRHRTFSAATTLEQEPALRAAGLAGSVRFYDCREDDARLCLDNLHHAADLGAVCANYCRVTRFAVADRRVTAADVRDQVSGDTFQVRARMYLNAAGPWAGQVGQLGPLPDRALALSPTKGIHLVLPRLTGECGVFYQARSDGRLVFVIPWLDMSIVGSTDTDYRGDPADAATDAADIAYLLGELRQLMPERRFDESDIIASFAGVRPLLGSGNDPSARSREHAIAWQGENLFSIAGGKYTTYRPMAAQAVDLAVKSLGCTVRRCQTATTPLPRYRPSPEGDRLSDLPDVHASDVRYACRAEMALTVADVMRRRTPLALSRHGGAQVAGQVAGIMGAIHGWDRQEQADQVAAYLEACTRGTL